MKGLCIGLSKEVFLALHDAGNDSCFLSAFGIEEGQRPDELASLIIEKVLMAGEVPLILGFQVEAEVPKRLKDLSEKLKIPVKELVELFITRWLAIFQIAGQAGRGSKDELLTLIAETETPKPIDEGASKTRVVIDLADLPPQIADYIGTRAANESKTFEELVLGNLKAWFEYVSGDCENPRTLGEE